MMPQVHPLAVVSPEANVGEGCVIGPFCYVGEGVELGPGNQLISHVRIEGTTWIGSDNTFHPFSSIGAVPQDLKYQGERSGVRIGSRNHIREGVTIHRGTAGGRPQDESMTILGNDNLIMAYTHIAHDCNLGDHIVIANGTQLAGHVLIDDYARLGGANLVVQYVRIGRHAFTGAGVVIRKDIPPFVLGAGDPVFRPSGVNRVGMERARFSAESIESIKRAYQLFFMSGATQSVALENLRNSFKEDQNILEFVQFIENSELGVHR